MIHLVEPVLDHPILIVILVIALQMESTNIFKNKLLLLELESVNKVVMIIIMNQLTMKLIIFVNNVILIV